MSFRAKVAAIGVFSILGLGISAPAAVAAPCGTLPGARSELVGASPNEELFLGGNYIELGISKLGNFGTRQDKPSGFFGVPLQRTSIGMTADYDGFACGLDFPIDFFLPGGPEERYNFGFKVGSDVSYASLSELAGGEESANLSRPTSTEVVLTNESTGSNLKGKVVTSFKDRSSNVIAVLTQTISFGVNDKYFTNSIKIENLSGTTWDSVRYMRNVDPDNGKDQSANYDTDNEVISTIAADGASAVRAQIQSADVGTTIPLNFSGSMAPLIYYSKDAGARASTYGFYNANPYNTTTPVNNFDNPRPKNELHNADEAITMTIEKLNIASGSSFTTNYITSLDQRDFAAVESELETAAENAANPTPQTVVTPENVVTPTIATVSTPAVSVVEISTKNIRFNTGTSVLTPAAKKKLKKNLAGYKSATLIRITGGAGYLPGVNKSQVEKLAKNRAKSIEKYLKTQGVKQANFENAVKTFRIGKIPSSKVTVSN